MKTNEEKAREIAKEYSRPYGFGLNNDSSVECYQSALQAMEWKDEQHEKEKQQFIEKACKWLDDKRDLYFAESFTFILGDFKKAMEYEIQINE